jgi:hypothetical protein
MQISAENLSMSYWQNWLLHQIEFKTLAKSSEIQDLLSYWEPCTGETIKTLTTLSK